MKVLENCNTIVASSLEQTNWLRKNLHVRVAQPDLESTTDSSNELDHTPDIENNSLDFDGLCIYIYISVRHGSGRVGSKNTDRFRILY
jgi:hypothetical protein